MAPVMAADSPQKSIWVGHQFQPEQCVAIKPGISSYKRKLCTVKYEIKWVNGLYRVNGALEFDERFIPPNTKSVDLEVLLIGQDYRCNKQIDISKKAEDRPVTFSLVVENIPDYRNIRTYYIIKYQDLDADN
jgi:hypothetical protein